MATYVVMVDMVGFPGGVARRGETVTAAQFDTDSVQRLRADRDMVDAPAREVAAEQVPPKRSYKKRVVVDAESVEEAAPPPPEEEGPDLPWLEEVGPESA